MAGGQEDPDAVVMKLIGVFILGVFVVLALLWMFQESQP